MTALFAAFAAAWIALALRLAWMRWHAPVLPMPLVDLPRTTVLLPVRDEEANLEPCLASLLAQDGAPEIFVIDDGSTDSTPGQLAAAVSRCQRIRAFRARPLPAGWTGKVNALDSAFAEVATPWLLLTDADTRHAPDLLSRAQAAAAEHRLDAVSLAGRQEARGFGENLLTPPAFALLDLLLGDWRPHARGEGKIATANGQYFLLRTEALREIGGFERLVGQPLDDVMLARALRAAGFRVGFRRAGGLLRIRMYRGFGASARGWRRNFALLTSGRTHVGAWIAGLAVLTAAALLAPLASARVLSLAATWATGALASALVRQGSHNNPLAGILFPLDLFCLTAIVLLADLDRLRGRLSPWRGREIRTR